MNKNHLKLKIPKTKEKTLEECGYRQDNDYPNHYDYFNDKAWIFTIRFNTPTKEIIFETLDDEIPISLDELNAIVQKVKELKWTD